MNEQIINEPMKVELGFFQIFAFLFNPAFWAGVTQVTTSASALMLTNSIVQSFSQPKTESVSMPGVLASRGLSPAVATALRKAQTELEALQQEGLKKQEELATIETQTALKNKTANFLSKYGLFLVAGGTVLITVLAVRKRKKK